MATDLDPGSNVPSFKAPDFKTPRSGAPSFDQNGRAAERDRLEGNLVARFSDRLALLLLLAALLYAPLAQGSLYPWSLFGLRALIALTLALTGVAAALRGRLELPPLWVTATFGGFLTYYTLSASFSPNTFGTQQALLDTFSQAAGFVLAATLVRGRRRGYAFVAALLAGALAMGVYGVVQVLGHGVTPTMFDPLPPISSFYYNRIHYAGFLDLAALTALGVTLFAPAWWVRLGAGALALLLYVNLGLTFSDAGWVATGLATLALLILWIVKAPARLRAVRILAFVVILGTGVAGLGAFLYNAPGLSGSFADKLLTLRGVTPDGEPTTAGLGNFYSRLYIYGATLEVIREQPVTGVGPGNFIYALPKWRPPNALDFRSSQLHKLVNYAHNDYLQIASEAGIPAALLFIAFWLAVLTRARKAPLPLVGLTFGLVALLIHGLVDGNLTVNHASAFLAYAAAGVLVASRTELRDRDR